MIIDLNKSPKNPKTTGFDVCICGAGVAGITLAIHLAKAQKKVALIEAGDLEFTEQSMEAYKGKSVGMDYWGLEACRLRYFGGTSNHWSGRCKPFSEVDFVERDFFGLPGWPIPKSELDQFESQTKQILDIKADFVSNPLTDWGSKNLIQDGYALSPPTRFAIKYHDEIQASENITLFLNANLSDIVLDQGQSKVSEYTVINYRKEKYRFSGEKFVMALGAIENARVLLSCDKQLKQGIGNHSDFVGRCFMEHFEVDFGGFIANKKYWEQRKGLGLYTTSSFTLENKIGSGTVSMSISPDPKVGGGRTKEIRKFFRNNVCKSPAITEFSKKYVDFHCPGEGIVGALIEQSPNKNSRITLDNETDSLGMRRVRLDWEMNELDKKTIRTIALNFAKEFALYDYGRVQLPSYLLNENEPIPVAYHCHHIGTTRMAKKPEDGVVDENCKVFGIDNFYIGGSSAFSTGSGTNPTFTIVELTLRLAKHLNS